MERKKVVRVEVAVAVGSYLLAAGGGVLIGKSVAIALVILGSLFLLLGIAGTQTAQRRLSWLASVPLVAQPGAQDAPPTAGGGGERPRELAAIPPDSPTKRLRKRLSETQRVRAWLSVQENPDQKLPLADDPVYKWAKATFKLIDDDFSEHADAFMGADHAALGSSHFATAYALECEKVGRQGYLEQRIALVKGVLRRSGAETDVQSVPAAQPQPRGAPAVDSGRRSVPQPRPSPEHSPPPTGGREKLAALAASLNKLGEGAQRALEDRFARLYDAGAELQRRSVTLSVVERYDAVCGWAGEARQAISQEIPRFVVEFDSGNQLPPRRIDDTFDLEAELDGFLDEKVAYVGRIVTELRRGR